VKLTKILGLAFVAAVAVAAFAGSASAARLHPLIVGCKAQELLLCAAKNRVKLAGGLLWVKQIGTGILEGTINQKCTGGEGMTEVGEMKDEPEPSTTSRLFGTVTEAKFTGCEPCKKIVTTPPYKGNIKMTEEIENGKWTLEGSGNAKFEECSFGVTCKFGAKELKPAPFIEMTATEAIVNSNKAEVQREEGSEFFCGNTGKLNAKASIEYGSSTERFKVWPSLVALCTAKEIEEGIC
jgi:hypothetical protein